MTEQTATVPLQMAVVTDRGLSDKRPLNEDSFLADPQRRIFAVADGVGGAQAGEVASQTAVEVLDEAFRHQIDGSDIEDLMEIAIQRANNSIFRMSREHPKLSMMATTVVALHLDGRIATIGHVGDSRLYRLTPDGNLHRETADHSVVEEEVRAGRMTPEQAANHPSRNVISRALGAEEGVEVDLKTMEVADGTAFMLCSDGITRHIPDNEIRELLSHGRNLEEVCAEMKRRCYERGAEDNLTAVVVRVGEATATPDDPDRTISPDHEHTALASTQPLDGRVTIPIAAQPATMSTAATTATAATVATAAPAVKTETADAIARAETTEIKHDVVPAAPPRRGFFGKLVRFVGFLILLGAVGAGAFYGGMLYHQLRDDQTKANSIPPAPTPTPEDALAKFTKQRQEVDHNPSTMANKYDEDLKNKTLETKDAETLYLYGRALLLKGRHDDALIALELATGKIDKVQDAALKDELAVETRMAKAAAASIRASRQGLTMPQQAKELDEYLKSKNPAAPPTPNAEKPPNGVGVSTTH